MEDVLEKQIQEFLCVVRLQVQKKVWREKLFRAIVCSVFNVRELEKIEAEEAAKSIQVGLFDLERQ